MRETTSSGHRDGVEFLPLAIEGPQDPTRVAQSLVNRQIAAQLNLAESTVAHRLAVVFQKLHVNNRTQAALVALRRGWASLNEA